MRAVVCNQYGPPQSLRVQEWLRPKLAPEQVRVSVRAAGVNFVDSLFVAGTYQIRIPPPFVPGGDVAGVITELGSNVQGVSIGDRILASPGVGAFAEEVALDFSQLTPVPEGMSDLAAATFVQANATAWFALVNRGQLQAGETLLVLGAAGGTGMAAIHIGKALGARVIAAASTAEKLDACGEAGADELVNYSEEDFKKRVKALGSVDMVFDPVGGALSELALRCCRPNARFLVIGFASGEIARIPLNLVLLKKCQIVGVDWGGSVFADVTLFPSVCARILELHGAGKLPDPPYQVFPLERTADALQALRERRVIGKAVIQVGEN